MITAYAVTLRHLEKEPIAFFKGRRRAERYSAAYDGGAVVELVDKEAILRKFDAYVPADQASSMRFRIVELEEVVRAEVAARVPLTDRIRELEAQVAELLASRRPAAPQAARERSALIIARTAIECLIECVPFVADGRNDEALDFGDDAIRMVNETLAATAAPEQHLEEARTFDDFAAWAARASADMLDDQCDGWAGLPMEDVGLLS